MISAARDRRPTAVIAGRCLGEDLPAGSCVRGDGRSVVAVVDAGCRLVIWFGWMVLLAPLQVMAVALDLRLAETIPVLFHRVSCRIFGIQIVTSGRPSRARPTVFVANHSSYFDIPVLSCVVRASFVAKAEVRGWPLVGLLARLQRSVFISRRVAGTRDARDQIADRLRAGHNLILFPEGTTNDGNRVLPFRSALFGLADERLAAGGLTVQPLTVAYTHENGMPIGQAGRARYAWFGDMELAPHFWTAIQSGRITVRVDFHEPVEPARFPTRKALAGHCREVIAAGLARALHGAGSA